MVTLKERGQFPEERDVYGIRVASDVYMAFGQTKEGKIEPQRPLYDNKMTQPSILIPRLTQVSIFVEEDRNGRSPLF